MSTLKIFKADGMFAEDHPFSGSPMTGDGILLGDGCLVYVISRRWTKDGNLELIVDPDPEA